MIERAFFSADEVAKEIARRQREPVGNVAGGALSNASPQTGLKSTVKEQMTKGGPTSLDHYWISAAEVCAEVNRRKGQK